MPQREKPHIETLRAERGRIKIRARPLLKIPPDPREGSPKGTILGRSLAPLVKARGFGMTHPRSEIHTEALAIREDRWVIATSGAAGEGIHIALKTKLISLVSLDPIVTVCVEVPSFSCHALIV